MTQEELKSLYKTSDLALAAIISLQSPIELIDRTNPRKALFFFKRSKKLDKAIKAYWRGETRVEPRAYFDELRRIKARLYEGR